MNQIWKPQSHAGFPHISMSQLGEALPQGHAHVVSRRSMRQKVPGHSKVWFRWTSRGMFVGLELFEWSLPKLWFLHDPVWVKKHRSKDLGCCCQALCSSNLLSTASTLRISINHNWCTILLVLLLVLKPRFKLLAFRLWFWMSTSWP